MALSSNRTDFTAADRIWVEQRARAAGFDLAGVAAVPEPQSAQSAETDCRFADWIAQGRAGEMDYLKRRDDTGELLRGDLRRAIPWARSVVVCAVNYNAVVDGEEAPRSIDPAATDAGWIARYAWSGRERHGRQTISGGARGSDYHDVLLPRLRVVEAELQQRFACRTRCYVDTGPIVERDYAERAGIGWIGKNTCLLNQEQGSWLLLGVIVTSLELAPEAWSVPAADRCGSCTRCIDACPTDALVAPRQMDASRCIAYLTIEKKGSIAEALRAPMGRNVFGCDICQDVCPWNDRNARTPIASASPLQPRAELINPALAWLASLHGPEFARVFRGSPVERRRRDTSRRKQFRRNLAIAMGNSGERKFLPQLEAWAAASDPVLAETAAWAAARLRAAAQ
jgi:epoxyqueuosine reductase